MPPVCARNVAPPLKVIEQIDRLARWSKDDGAGDQVFARRGGKVFCARLTLCDRHVVRCLSESSELVIGNFRLIDPIPIDVHAMPGSSVWHVVVVSAHPELAAWNPDHSCRYGGSRRTIVNSWHPSILSCLDGRDVGGEARGLSHVGDPLIA